jgi:hypothetical protein
MSRSSNSDRRSFARCRSLSSVPVDRLSTYNGMPHSEQSICQMRAEEAGRAGNQNSGHGIRFPLLLLEYNIFPARQLVIIVSEQDFHSVAFRPLPSRALPPARCGPGTSGPATATTRPCTEDQGASTHQVRVFDEAIALTVPQMGHICAHCPALLSSTVRSGTRPLG